MRTPAHRTALALLVTAAVAGCAPASDSEPGTERAVESPDVDTERGGALAEVVRLAEARADSMEVALQPVPLLRPAEERALTSHGSARHLASARRLGLAERPATASNVEAVAASGDLVRLDDTDLWVVRDLDHSHPWVTRDVVGLLTELGERFQTGLGEVGLPAFRLEVTSALRTAEDQAELRGVNINAARGASTHEYGTTVDIAYAGFAAPAAPMSEVVSSVPDAMAPLAASIAAAFAERAAGRKSRELQAILGRLLEQMQAEGKVHVTLEQLQPVYHITVARRY
jgi:hypothetical protein